ncbi:PAP2-domain-containing protein, partial [Ascodesmis nigricans]
DYLLLALLIGGVIFIAFLEPFHRHFSLSDQRIQYPHADPERVPVSVCILLSAGLPLVFIICGGLIRSTPSTLERAASKSQLIHLGILGLFLSLMSATFVTDLIKNLYGRPRPDLLARCKPAPGTPETGLVEWTVCTETHHHTLHDGWRSFPSGHSSFAFSGLWYLMLWTRSVVGRRWGLVLGGWPVVMAMWIAGSRTRDYRHDSYDVTVGSLIGIAAAAWA